MTTTTTRDKAWSTTATTSTFTTTGSCPSDLHETFCYVLPATKRLARQLSVGPARNTPLLACTARFGSKQRLPVGPFRIYQISVVSALLLLSDLKEVAPRALSVILYHVLHRAASPLPVAGEARLPGRRARGRARRGAAVQSKHRLLQDTDRVWSRPQQLTRRRYSLCGIPPSGITNSACVCMCSV